MLHARYVYLLSLVLRPLRKHRPFYILKTLS